MIKKLNLLSKQPIAIFSLGTSFIAAQGGVSDCICERIFCEVSKTFEIRKNGKLIPLGRICFPNKYQSSKNVIKKDNIKMESLIKRIKHNFQLDYLRYVGELNSDIKKICIIGGSFTNKDILKKARDLKCDCFISGNFNYFESIYAKEIGLNLIEIPHYLAAYITLRNLTNILSLKFPHDEILCFVPEDPIQFL
jgi:putative NIF3 family GTP cyclohydrolase 1 type 2